MGFHTAQTYLSQCGVGCKRGCRLHVTIAESTSETGSNLVSGNHLCCDRPSVLFLTTPTIQSPMAVQSKQTPPTQLTPLGYALAGALGGCFSNAYAFIVYNSL